MTPGRKPRSRRPSGRSRPRNDRKHTAIHEAGHAVIGRVLKQVCRKTTIVESPENGEAGHTVIADVDVTEAHWGKIGRERGNVLASIVRGRIMTFMAGREAEEEFFGHAPAADDDDRRQINFMLDDLLPADADLPGYASRLRNRTRGLVRRHRRTIERVAELLLEHDTLDGRRIDRAMRAKRD